ncbi:MAG: BppU family phage baseplate upper protein [Gordonibacter sp.]|uniref:BppU family phage baseplate upper protein n=1 Tax=Gordonibacter sp. TaxID=1968902 RepID=UPI002FCA6FAF
MAQYDIGLDTHKHTYPMQLITARQGELDGTTISATITKNGTPYDLAGLSVRFECVMPTGEWVRDTQTNIAGSVVSHVIAQKTLAASGHIHLAYFALYDSAGKKIETTDGFFINVLKSATFDADISAYSDQVDMLVADVHTLLVAWQKQCADQDAAFTSNEAGRIKAASDLLAKIQRDYTTAEAARDTSYTAAEATRTTTSDAATKRANDAATKVDQAISGNLQPYVDTAVAAQKDKAGGILGYDKYQREHYVADGTTIIAYEDGGVKKLKAAPGSSADGTTITATSDATGAKTFSVKASVMADITDTKAKAAANTAAIATTNTSVGVVADDVAKLKADMGTVSGVLKSVTGVA